MSEYTVTIQWERGGDRFTDKRYSRRHTWSFDCGLDLAASSSPHVVPLPYSDPGAVDPEEAFIAALSSCHMLSFLYVAARQGWCVDRYTDQASGVLEPNPAGRMAVTRVTLRPAVAFSGQRLPGPDEIQAMHAAAHEECYIANSVKTEVRCEPLPAA
ncbi:MAG: peroxiredoxin [Chloroflexi bacterium]|nr:OsmC family protein [Anaerolineaceae bacterium]NMB86772.1 peroxiredoxin [Chloroflexota bacterium]